MSLPPASITRVLSPISGFVSPLVPIAMIFPFKTAIERATVRFASIVRMFAFVTTTSAETVCAKTACSKSPEMNTIAANAVIFLIALIVIESVSLESLDYTNARAAYPDYRHHPGRRGAWIYFVSLHDRAASAGRGDEEGSGSDRNIRGRPREV